MLAYMIEEDAGKGFEGGQKGVMAVGWMEKEVEKGGQGKLMQRSRSQWDHRMFGEGIVRINKYTHYTHYNEVL